MPIPACHWPDITWPSCQPDQTPGLTPPGYLPSSINSEIETDSRIWFEEFAGQAGQAGGRQAGQAGRQQAAADTAFYIWLILPAGGHTIAAGDISSMLLTFSPTAENFLLLIIIIYYYYYYPYH